MARAGCAGNVSVRTFQNVLALMLPALISPGKLAT
jgi:hypothetical protein